MTKRQSRPTVSVIIPLYNHQSFIAEALHSVFGQTAEIDEVLVLDDGSSDAGYETARAIAADHSSARMLKQENQGAHAALNRLVTEATSDYIAVLNSDDVFDRHKIERCLELLSQDRTTDLIFGEVSLIDDRSVPLREGIGVEWYRSARRFHTYSRNMPLSLINENLAVTTSNIVFSKKIWAASGGFQPLRYCHDLDFVLAACENGNVRFDDVKTHISYRIHSQNTITETSPKVVIEIAAVIAAYVHFSKNGLDIVNQFSWKSRMLADIFARKSLGDVVAVLSALCSQFGHRSDFYQYITHPEQMRALGKYILETKSRDRALARIVRTPVSGRGGAGKVLPSPLRTLKTLFGGKEGKNIVVEVASFDKGGLEKVVLDTAILFRRRGFNPIIVSAGPVGHLGSLALEAGLEVVRLPKFARNVVYERLLKTRDIKIAISHFSRTGYPLFRKLRIPNITFIHNVYAMLRGKALDNFKADDAAVDRYISVSRNATSYAVDRLGVAPRKIIDVPNGVIIDDYLFQGGKKAGRIRRQDVGLEDNDYVFLNVASYNLHKGHYLMVQALDIVRRTRQDVKILCVGNEIYPPHVEELRSLIAAKCMTGHMLMPGYFEDIAELHAISDAFLLPSFVEGWSIAMNEAMFFEKPMILTDTGGAAEVIEDSDIGLLIPNEYGDTIALDSELLDRLSYTSQDYKIAPKLAAAMLDFADRRTHWAKAGKRGRQKVLQHYDFERIVDRYIAEIERLRRR